MSPGLGSSTFAFHPREVVSTWSRVRRNPTIHSYVIKGWLGILPPHSPTSQHTQMVIDGGGKGEEISTSRSSSEVAQFCARQLERCSWPFSEFLLITSGVKMNEFRRSKIPVDTLEAEPGFTAPAL